jgi:hypothetical protein
MRIWLLFCVAYLHAVPFYQQPNLEGAYQGIEQLLLENMWDERSSEDNSYRSFLASVFVANVMKVHPELIEGFISEYPSLSTVKKQIVEQGLKIAKIDDARIPISSASPNFDLARLDQFEIMYDYDLDLLRVSYLATGNETYLATIMRFLNSDPELLVINYELDNSQFLIDLIPKIVDEPDISGLISSRDELLDLIQNLDPETKMQFIFNRSAHFALSIIKRDDPTAAEKIDRLCDSRSDLNYRETLTTIINPEPEFICLSIDQW